MLLSLCASDWRGTGLILLLAAALGAAGCQAGRARAESPQSLESLPRRSVASLAPPQGAWFVPKYPELMPPDMPATQGVGATGVKVLPSVASLATNQHHGAMVHRVRPGDTMYGLARQYYGDAGLWRLLLDANRAAIPDPARLSSGVLVYLPTEPLRSPDGRLRPPGRCPDYYVVAPGDTLGFIAETFLGRREAYSDLARHNRLATPDQIAPGMMLAIATP